MHDAKLRIREDVVVQDEAHVRRYVEAKLKALGSNAVVDRVVILPDGQADVYIRTPPLIHTFALKVADDPERTP